MSSALYWKPPEPDGKTLGDELKFILRSHYGGHFYDWQVLNKHDIGFLRGVIAAADDKSRASKDAQFLIQQIERYGHVEVRESY